VDVREKSTKSTPGPSDYQTVLGCRRDYSKGASILHKHPLAYESFLDSPGPGTYTMTSKGTGTDTTPIKMSGKWRRDRLPTETPGPGAYYSPRMSRRRPTATVNVQTPVLRVTGKDAPVSCMLSETKRSQTWTHGASQTSSAVQQVLYADTLAAAAATTAAAAVSPYLDHHHHKITNCKATIEHSTKHTKSLKQFFFHYKLKRLLQFVQTKQLLFLIYTAVPYNTNTQIQTKYTTHTHTYRQFFFVFCLHN
jgi:hypothetical protein